MAASIDEDLSDFYEPGSLNIQQYYEYRDKYFVESNQENNSVQNNDDEMVANSSFMNSSAKVQLAAIINNYKDRKIGLPAKPYNSLESSNAEISKEIANMLIAENIVTENHNFKFTKRKSKTKENNAETTKTTLETTNTKSLIDSDDDRLRVVGLSNEIYLNDSFFDLKGTNETKYKQSSNNVHNDVDYSIISAYSTALVTSPSKSLLSTSEKPKPLSTKIKSSKIHKTNDIIAAANHENNIYDDNDDDVFIQRANARYAEPIIGVPEERYCHSSTRTAKITDFINETLAKRSPNKSPKNATNFVGLITVDSSQIDEKISDKIMEKYEHITKDNELVEKDIQKIKKNTGKTNNNINNLKNRKCNKSRIFFNLNGQNIITDCEASTNGQKESIPLVKVRDVNNQFVKLCDKSTYYTPREIYNMKRNIKFGDKM